MKKSGSVKTSHNYHYLLAGFLVVMINDPALAQEPVVIAPSDMTLGSNRDNMETEYYEVTSFGWLQTTVNANHDEYFYPTVNDHHDAGYYNIDHHNVAIADFNADGRQDMLVTWGVFPHSSPRDFKVPYSILLNQGDNSFRLAPELFEGAPPKRNFAYRTATADFNQDGWPDVVSSSMGANELHADGSYSSRNEPIPLLLSTPSGHYRDATDQIEGQEDGGLPTNFTFGHELSVGDFSGDGIPDIFTGKIALQNDGTGHFSNVSSQLPVVMRPTSTWLMTSLIGDLNNDGVGDIVAAYTDILASAVSGYIMVSRNGDPSLSNRDTYELPVGMYGQNATKFNYGVIYDVNRDGRPDLVFSVTRSAPYYVGRQLQVIMNKGNGGWLDETATYVIGLPELDQAHGEGNLHIVDVNADGIDDLVHSNSTIAGPEDPHGMVVYLNQSGKLKALPWSTFPWVQSWQMAGEEDLQPWVSHQMGRAYPIDIDGKGGIDFIAAVPVSLREWPQVEPNRVVYYSINATNPLPTESRTDFVSSTPELGGIITNDGSPTTARFQLGASSDGGATTRTTFSASESVVIAGNVSPQDKDLGKAAEIYVVIFTNASTGDSLTYRDMDGTFRAWGGSLKNLQPAYEVDDLQTSSFEIFSGELTSATHRVFIGYSVIEDGIIHFTSSARRINVSE